MTTPAHQRSPADVPDLLLERYRLAELPAAEAKRLRALLAGDEGLRGRLNDLDRSDAAIAATYPLDRLALDVADRAGRTRSRLAGASPWRVARWAVPAAVAAALAVIVLRPAMGPTDGTPIDAEGERAKGSSALVIYRSTASGSETLADNETVRMGDVIRVGYRATAPEYGAIVSVDGRGVTTVHLPPAGQQAVALEPGHTVLLDRAFELDDAPLYERFYLVTGPTPFELTPVIDAVRRAIPAGGGEPVALTLPPSFSHTEFSLRKDIRP